MNKRFAAVLAATAIAGVTTAFAANPFSDVTPSDWAYQAVETLAAQGVIDGYPDGTFKGQNNITRYEMAQLVARAMARQDRVSAEQGAVINSLANEFADELNNLGVRVSNLEKKVGNVKFTGDARMRLFNYDRDNTKDSDKEDNYKYRVRFVGKAQVNENTIVGLRLKVENDFGNADSGNDTVKFDRAYAQHSFGNVVGTVGRYGLFLGNGLVYDSAFDGIAATGKLGNVTLTAGHGYAGKVVSDGNDPDSTSTYVQLGAKLGSRVDASAYYIANNVEEANPLADNVFGGALTTRLFSKVTADGEYASVKDNGAAWTAALTYGDYKISNADTWSLGVRYLVSDNDGPLNKKYNSVASTTFDHPALMTQSDLDAGLKAWSVEARYALSKNLGLNAYYYFNQETTAGADLEDAYLVDLKYEF